MLNAALEEGMVVGGDYRIIQPLKAGGMGAVYVAEQVSTGAQRAVKVMQSQLVRDPRLRQRFEQEARVGARIRSDHVVQVVAAGVDEPLGMPWLAMELLDGEDLEAAISRRGALPVDEVCEIFRQLCHAMAAAHAVGVVHRDLKPENIFLAIPRQAGLSLQVKVLDFGIARIVAEFKTTETAALGTPLWMAPEQTASGVSIGPPTDVWALGLLVFRMLTGQFYWRDAQKRPPSMLNIMRQVVVEPIVPASRRAAEYGCAHLLPIGFDDWFNRCVNREISARYANASTAWQAFENMGRRGATSEPPPYVPEPGPGPNLHPEPAPEGWSASSRIPPAPPPGLDIRHASRLPVKWNRRSVAIAGAAVLILGAATQFSFSMKQPDTETPASLEAGCRQKNLGVDCGKLASLYEHGHGVKKDTFQGLALYRQACTLADASSCVRAAWILRNGEYGLMRDADEAQKLFRHACDLQNPEGCSNLQPASVTPPPDMSVPPDMSKPPPPGPWERCKKGDMDTCQQLCGKNRKAACDKIASYVAKQCDRGNGKACAVIGLILYQGGKQVEGIKFLRRACELNYEDACRMLQHLLQRR